MKLNHDCIRDTLLAIESMNYVVENDDEICFEGIPLDELVEVINTPKEKYSRVEIFYTLQNLSQGGYIDASYDYSDDSLEYFIVNFITYSGHQFLDTVRDSEVWKNTKSIVSKVASVSLNMAENVAAQVITNIVDRRMS